MELHGALIESHWGISCPAYFHVSLPRSRTRQYQSAMCILVKSASGQKLVDMSVLLI